MTRGSPQEVLARIVPGDPLDLRGKVARRLRERSLVLDADRVVLRALASCARRAPSWRGRPGLEHWLRARVDEAVEELLAEEAEVLRDGSSPRGGAGGTAQAPPALEELGAPLGLEGTLLRRALDALNAGSPEDREAFFRLVIDGVELDELARVPGRLGRSASQVARRARRILDAVLTASRTPTPTPKQGGAS